MSKSAYIRARIEPDLKIEAEAIFQKLGVTATQVITMLYRQVLRTGEIPLDLSLTKKEISRQEAK
ncbi:RelB antitoxin [Legionella wadsworthii]|uniref:RelB antitoxin n=1 Tax=Legionella wadsworthii TaxID=28088 RepID=A0A378P4E3_9GAMM|nr:type II toxin-antitoxin system RelB/DinJ family antitoxin [Legionella wadsworthii]STY78981.1 RelB antitoxin [Legionella wadsworthii]